MLPPYFQKEIFVSGNIRGKFKSSFNIELRLSNPVENDSFLVHIGSLLRPLCSFGISVEEGDMKDMLESCEEGSLVCLRQGKLRIYGREEQFILNLGDKENFWEKNLQIPTLHKDLPVWKESVIYDLLKRDVEDGSLENHMGISWDGDFLEHCMGMKEAETSWKEEIQFFCGRGKGLTPSGDDILLGYMAVLMAAGQEMGFTMSSFAAEYAASKTTSVSLAYYRALSAGFVNEDFREFLLCLLPRGGKTAEKASDKKKYAEQIIRQIRSLGHTSGHDTLFGAFLALERLKNARQTYVNAKICRDDRT